MADDHFATTYQLKPPIERVRRTLHGLDHHPAWSTEIFQAQQLEPVTADGLGGKIHYKVTGRLTFTLASDAIVTHADPPRVLELRPLGELEGVRDAGHGLARFLGVGLIGIQVGSRRTSSSPA